jgi:hypothetical protein
MCQKKSVILLSTEIYGNEIAGSEQNYKPEVILQRTRKKGAVNARDEITRQHS